MKLMRIVINAFEKKGKVRFSPEFFCRSFANGGKKIYASFVR